LLESLTHNALAENKKQLAEQKRTIEKLKRELKEPK